MKKVVLTVLSFMLAACSTPVQQSSVPMDMQAVEEYKQRVASGKTVDPNDSEEWELNQSDKRARVEVYHHYPYPRIRPHIGYHYYGRHHSGVGVGFGYY
ncbi:hypothetical protein [Glaesserella sp.]|uniref:hypothetical protein n=1 Tax=Glaesserella sp. TaxID=2094731 RepID=UPI0035A0FDEF